MNHKQILRKSVSNKSKIFALALLMLYPNNNYSVDNKDSEEKHINRIENISTYSDSTYNNNNLESNIQYYSESNKDFSDNEYYKKLREMDAIDQILTNLKDKYTNTNIFIVNKTFQKAMLIKVNYRREKSDEETRIDILNDTQKSTQDNNTKEKQTSTKEYLITQNTVVKEIIELKIILETDCSTAKIYGKKEYNGDGKTPEGIFYVKKIENSSEWRDNINFKKVYGPKFLSIYEQIGIHGTGTDTISTDYKNRTNKNTKEFEEPEPLGVMNNDFGKGKSHGCIRLDNRLIDTLVTKNYLMEGTPVIIFENRTLTNMLNKYYTDKYCPDYNNVQQSSNL